MALKEHDKVGPIQARGDSAPNIYFENGTGFVVTSDVVKFVLAYNEQPMGASTTTREVPNMVVAHLAIASMDFIKFADWLHQFAHSEDFKEAMVNHHKEMGKYLGV